jgi:hypothetical protein
MSKSFFTILFVAGIAYMCGSCNSGAYVANPSSNANGSINPLNPLKAEQFSWAGTGNKVSLNINGTPWSTDSAYLGWYDSIQAHIITAFGKDGRILSLELKDVWAGNVYNMGYKQYNRMGSWVDSFNHRPDAFSSVLGNSGGLYMITNDSLTFTGKFYFQSVDSAGNVDNITNGSFILPKF